MSLLEQATTRKKQVDKDMMELGFNAGNKEKYKVEAIWNSTIYRRELESYPPEFYYLVAWKDYLKKENTWEPVFAVQHLRKLISLFLKDYAENLTTTFLPLNSAPLIARSIVKPMIKSTTKRKRGRLANSANKWAKKN